MKDADMPLWQRDATPLLFAGDSLLWVAGLAVDEGCSGEADKMGWRLVWRGQNV